MQTKRVQVPSAGFGGGLCTSYNWDMHLHTWRNVVCTGRRTEYARDVGVEIDGSPNLCSASDILCLDARAVTGIRVLDVVVGERRE